MAVLVDSCVLLDVFEDDPQWFEWSVTQLERCSEGGPLLINPIIYAEISIGFERIEDLETQVRNLDLKLPVLPREALFLAGKAFLEYRRRGGQRRSPLPDFFIGAHASILKIPLCTADARRYQTYFPELELRTPKRTKQN